ncbi:MAG: MFS transporter [Rhodoferax sp.]|uniref:MFS transporter n=1 Tax=Rhodoferax sp. TaxID=50421 RepID=UPI0026210A2F|nr:MFS transporter [Rhodoferax sp.]MDD5332842.1 MFS transporter [Rhodoferax sp.]
MTHPATLTELQAHYGERYRWLLLLAVMVGTMAAIMSSTIVNVAVPDMSRHFGLGQERAQWVASGFMIAMTVSMLTTPWLLARYGYRRTYAGTMWLLLAGSIVGGLANDFSLVLAARVAEGLAAGVVQPIPVIIIVRAFQPHEQGRAGGIFGMGVVLAPAIGPSIGGLLVDWFGWRSIFFMVLPFCLASLWLAQRFVPTMPAGKPGAQRAGGKLDWRGLLLAGAGTVGLLNGLVQLRRGPAAPALLLLAGGVATLMGFVGWQRRLGRNGAAGAAAPLMKLALFEHRAFAMGSIVAFIYGMALFGSTYLLPVYMQLGLAFSASHVGTVLLPAGLVLALTIPLAGHLADRQPTHLLVSTGLVLLAASFVLMGSVGLGGSLWVLGAWAMLGRMGLGFILPSLNSGALRGLDKDLLPQGSSVINFLRTLGGAMGVSACGIVLEWRLASHGESLASRASNPARLAAFNETFYLLALLCALALLAAWRLRPGPRLKPA